MKAKKDKEDENKEKCLLKLDEYVEYKEKIKLRKWKFYYKYERKKVNNNKSLK